MATITIPDRLAKAAAYWLDRAADEFGCNDLTDEEQAMFTESDVEAMAELVNDPELDAIFLDWMAMRYLAAILRGEAKVEE